MYCITPTIMNTSTSKIEKTKMPKGPLIITNNKSQKNKIECKTFLLQRSITHIISADRKVAQTF